mmetsp:Transcript_51154/g.150733  ORF Transcript_51154/g.150733 Transcript_51154/m.150733 type:complete len:301 (-) Transcript_51154:1026-1928(-)
MPAADPGAGLRGRQRCQSGQPRGTHPTKSARKPLRLLQSRVGTRSRQRLLGHWVHCLLPTQGCRGRQLPVAADGPLKLGDPEWASGWHDISRQGARKERTWRRQVLCSPHSRDAFCRQADVGRSSPRRARLAGLSFYHHRYATAACWLPRRFLPGIAVSHRGHKDLTNRSMGRGCATHGGEHRGCTQPGPLCGLRVSRHCPKQGWQGSSKCKLWPKDGRCPGTQGRASKSGAGELCILHSQLGRYREHVPSIGQMARHVCAGSRRHWRRQRLAHFHFERYWRGIDGVSLALQQAWLQIQG